MSFQSAKKQHVSRTEGAFRLHTMAYRLSVALCGMVTLQSAVAEGRSWDCRATPDGSGWQCSQDGGATVETVPVRDPAPQISPAPEPTPAVAVPQPPTPPDPTPKRVKKAPATVPERAVEQSPAATRPKQADTPAPAVLAAPEPARRPALAPADAFKSSGEMPDLTRQSPSSPRPPSEAVTTVAPAPPRQVPPPDEQQPLEDAPLPSPELSGHEPTTATTAARSAIDEGIDWGVCRVRSTRPQLQVSPAVRSDRPVAVTADTAVAELDPETGVFSGNVRLDQDDVTLYADQLTVDRATGEVQASGNVVFTDPNLRMAGESATYSTETREAGVRQASYRVPTIRARGDAEHAAFLGNGISQFDNISYTTCAPDNNAWLLSADALELDQNEGRGTAKHAKLSFLGVPVLYAPRFTFPIDDRRRSGVLVPTIGLGGNNGFDLSVPYYFNLAENYDLTLTPRLMSKRGLMLSGEFRFLTESTSGTLAADILPDDKQRNEGSSTRGSASLYSTTQINPRTQANLQLNYVSDKDYFNDLGDSLAVTSTTHVQRTGEIHYRGDTWDLLGRAQYYQTIDDTIRFADRPYARLPQLRINLENPDGLAGLTYHLDADYTNFYRKESVRGHRIVLSPALSLPFRDAWWFIEPKAGTHYTAYDLTDQTVGLDESPSHLTGVFSLDSGLYFDRGMSYFGNAASQTLEPRAYYLYVPAGSQNDQPLFDTGLLDFNFDNLFRENRFNGPDRFADANQLTLALTSRIYGAASGEELLRASIGQILYFEDRTVTLPGKTEEEDNSSAIVGEIAAKLSRSWRARAGLQWDPHDGDDGTIDQALAQVSYRDDKRRVFNTAYRLRDGVIRQTDLAFYWPVYDSFTLIGRHNYSLRDNRLLEALAGIEYGSSCCWRARALVRKYTDDTGDEHNLAFMLQLELNGLGRLGNDIDTALERGVYGYRIEDND